jgi:hypothetical protein
MKNKNLFRNLIIAVAFLASTAFSLLSAQQDQKNTNDKIEYKFDSSVNLTIGAIDKMSGGEVDSYAANRINKHIADRLSKIDNRGEFKSEEELQRDYNIASYINEIFFKNNILGQPGKVEQFYGAYTILMRYLGAAAYDKPEYTFDQMFVLTVKKYKKWEQEQNKK